MKQIFLVEDDGTIAKNLILLLKSEDFMVTHAKSRKEAEICMEQSRFDLALIDISLPDGNGFSVCTQLKEMQKIPVIFLTAQGDEASVVTGLNMGADDYITKPFRPRELVARMKAALRKNSHMDTVFEIQNISVDLAGGIVKKGKEELNLSALEYRLLLIFVSNPNVILSRNRLLDELWDAAGEFVNDNTLTVYIKRLREKIEQDATDPKIIRTVRGIGYRLGESYVSK